MPETTPPITIPFKARAARLLIRLTRSAILMYFLVVLAMFAFQRYLIFPGTFRAGSPETHVQPDTGSELLHLQSPDGTPLTALFGKADPAPRNAPPRKNPPPTILYFYGNGDAMASATAEADMFRRMGANCMLIDYEGFGMSKGTASEQGCYNAAQAAYQYVLTRPDVDPKNLIAAGWSLGGAVAIDLAWRHRTDNPFAALLTFSTFTSMADMAKQNYPFLPTSLILRHHFKSLEKIADLKLPYFLGHGQLDPAIPFTNADRLATAFPAPTLLTRFTAPTAHHNDFFDAGGEPLETALQKFLHPFLSPKPYTLRPLTASPAPPPHSPSVAPSCPSPPLPSPPPASPPPPPAQ